MARNGELIVNVTGDEWQLRPVSAYGYIQAKTEGQMLAEELNAGEDEELIIRACVLAQGIFDHNGKVFASGMNVLELLTADEIYELVPLAFYSNNSGDTSSVEESRIQAEYDRIMAENTQRNGADNQHSSSAINLWLPKMAEGTAEDQTYTPIGHSAQNQWLTADAEKYTPAGYSAQGEERTYRDGVENLSRYLSRDSRRYDNGFEIY